MRRINHLAITRVHNPSSQPEREESVKVDLSDANCSQLGPVQRTALIALLQEFNDAELFAADLKRVPVGRRESLRLKLTELEYRPYVAGTRRYSPEETEAIQSKVAKLHTRGIIEPSTSLSAAACVILGKQ